MDDAGRLMAGVAVRDVAAFEAVYDRYHRLVYGVALRTLGAAAAAEDVTQAVFLKVWSTPEAFRGGNLGAWLARIARNRAIDQLRSRAGKDDVLELPADLPLEENVHDEVFARLDAERVRAALDALPEEQRTPIELGFFGGITHEEIARRTATPLGTVKTRIRSGLRRLRTSLEGSVV